MGDIRGMCRAYLSILYLRCVSAFGIVAALLGAPFNSLFEMRLPTASVMSARSSPFNSLFEMRLGGFWARLSIGPSFNSLFEMRLVCEVHGPEAV